MKKVTKTLIFFLVSVCIIPVFWACTNVQIQKKSLKGQYARAPFIVMSRLSYDEVWDKLVDYFVQNGLTFTLIDKASGLILAGKTQFHSSKFTIEENGKPKNPLAFVVVSSCEWDESTGHKSLLPDYVEADWSVRIKKVGDSTSLNINLVNLHPVVTTAKYYEANPYSSPKIVMGCTFEAKSTSVFERTTSEIFLK